MYDEKYKNLINHAKNENRIKNNGIYYEYHHINPDFLYKNRKRPGPIGHLDGDPNNLDNLVLLTFLEHLMSHYYLYKIYKGTRYEYAAGSSLLFFFTKSIGKHSRQLNISNNNKNLLKEMEYLKMIGIESIRKSKIGKMVAVDAITREKIGFVPTNHPNVISGKWIHHSKGVPGKSGRDMRGVKNNNFKELTQERRKRLWKCVAISCEDGYLKLTELKKNMEKEFIEFKKISLVWIKNNFDSIDALVKETNENLGLTIKYDSYHKSINQRKILSEHSSKHRWYNNGIKNIRVTNEEEFRKNNPTYVLGKLKI